MKLELYALVCAFDTKGKQFKLYRVELSTGV